MPDNKTAISATQAPDANPSSPTVLPREKAQGMPPTPQVAASSTVPPKTETNNTAQPASPKEQTPASANEVSETLQTDGVAKSTTAPTAPTPAEQTVQAIPELVLSPPPVATALEKINSRLSPAMKMLLLAVLLPTFLTLLYYGLYASPMYIAEAHFAVRGAESSGISTGLMAMLMPAATAVGVDANIVAEYIQSPDIMEAIDEEMGIFSHFSSRAHDLISRLAADATRDERLSYWKWAVKPSFDPETGIIALAVKAYDPFTAKKLAESVLSKSEALVNAMSQRAQADAIALAADEVKTAEKRVMAAQEAMREFRNRSGMLDPVSTAGGLHEIVSQLESDAVKTRAEIAEASTYMSKDAPALVALRARLDAVEKQLASEKLRLAGEATRPDSLTSFAGEYEALQTESEFARQQLVSAMTALETARVKAESKSRYVVDFQKPALPDESLYPRPWLFTAYVFFGALVLAALASLIIAAVREHAGF